MVKGLICGSKLNCMARLSIFSSSSNLSKLIGIFIFLFLFWYSTHLLKNNLSVLIALGPMKSAWFNIFYWLSEFNILDQSGNSLERLLVKYYGVVLLGSFIFLYFSHLRVMLYI